MKLTTRIALFVFLLTAFMGVKAATVSEATARVAAINFFKANNENLDSRTPLSASLKATKTEANGTVDFYVFDISPVTGFVIISADDRATPVLAYSFTSVFHADNKGRGIKTWMDHAGARVYKAIQQNILPTAQISNQWAVCLQGQTHGSAKSIATAVAPLIKTNWDQEPFYNQLCPYNTVDQQRALTGCVATAMAQIMKYWNYPAHGTGSYGYLNAPPTSTWNYGNQFADFGNTTYQWQAMPNSIDTVNMAIATLMYHCGVAAGMNYGDDNQGGSGSAVLSSETASWKHSAQMAYTTYFAYNPNTLTGVKMADYTAEAWMNLMKAELNAGRPIQYEGTDVYDGGHTWVCDGYDANNMLHMNWGWGGLDNGYFSVTSLTADGSNFINDEAALIGIEPATDLAVSASAVNTTLCNGSTTTLNAQASSAHVSYLWSPTAGLSCPTCASTQASPTASTTYTLTIDSAGLSASAHVTITVSNLHADSTKVANVTCNGAANGAGKVYFSGGINSNTYIWNNNSTRNAISAVGAGIYTVTATDAVGCSATGQIAISQPDAVVPSIQALNANCSLQNAVLNATATGGNGVYTYQWNNQQQTADIAATVAGTYAVTVADAAGCTASAAYNLVQPNTMVVTLAVANTTCSLSNGTVTANVSGVANPSFLWANGATTASITNLSAGGYSVTVSDETGCSVSDSVALSLPDTLQVSVITTTANINNTKVLGKAVASVTGGAPQYDFVWSTGETTEAINYTTPGEYIVTITDSKGCRQTAFAQVAETTATGIDALNNSLAFNVYPNPATNEVTVSSSSMNNTSTDIAIKNILGQTLWSSTVTSLQSRINLSAFSNGLYFVVLSQGQNSGVQQLVIKK